jgi:hypothetical protein
MTPPLALFRIFPAGDSNAPSSLKRIATPCFTGAISANEMVVDLLMGASF